MKVFKRMMRTVPSILLAFILLFSLVNCATNADKESNRKNTLAEDMTYIIHGAGEILGHNAYGEETMFTVSNSKDALIRTADAGCRFIELDFSFSSDGRLVCLHDWYHMYCPDIETDVPQPLDAFLKMRIYRSFDPLWIGDVADFLRDNPDKYIITDVKQDNVRALTMIAEEYPDIIDQLIVQIYSEDEYDPVSELGYENIIFTLYRLGWKEKTDVESLQKFAKHHKLVGITFSSELCDEVKDYTEKMLGIGVPLFVHTVDDPKEQQKYLDMGISGIYTNVVLP